MVTEPVRRGSLKAIGMLVLCTACWGVSFPLMKALLITQGKLVPAASVWFLTGQGMMWRFGLGAIILAAAQPRRLARLNWTEAKLGIGLGLTGGGGMLFQMAGLNDTLASTSAFLTQFYVLVIPAVLALYYRRWPRWLVWLSCGMVIAGMGMLCGVDWRNFRLGHGEWLTVLAAVIFTGQILWLDGAEFRDCDKTNATIIMFLTIAGLLLPLALGTAPRVSDIVTINLTLPAVVIQAGLVLVAAIGGFILMNTWQPHVTPTQAGLVYCAEPVFASLAALYLPALLAQLGGITYANEILTPHLLWGGVLITAANVLIQFEK